MKYVGAVKNVWNLCCKSGAYKNTPPLYVFLRYVYCNFMHGYVSEDYFMLRGGFERSLAEIRNTITYKRWLNVRNKFNDHTKEHVLLNKVETYRYFADFVHHKWLYPRESTIEQFEEFVSSVGRIIQKPLEEQQGHGVRLFVSTGDLNEDFKRCVEDNVLLDECIKQDSRMMFGNKSVNTIRIYTILDSQGKAHVVQAILRVGVGDSVVDNYCGGGCIYPLDLDTGKVDNTGWSHGADYSGIKVHPGTCIQMVGYQIPFWKEVRQYAVALAEHLPEVRCVGWDVVVADNPFHVDLIEGNHDAHSGMLAMDQKVTYKQLLELVNV